jgi:hypothetical protein
MTFDQPTSPDIQAANNQAPNNQAPNNQAVENQAGMNRDRWKVAYHLFLRLLALFFIIFTLQSWMRAIGISGAGSPGFDTMPAYWRMAIAALCILHPVTALGLWGLFAWGIAVWLISIIVQLAMHLVFTDLYGPDQTLVIFHISSFAIFIIFHIAIRIAANRK